jgi:hypothetical protein
MASRPTIQLVDNPVSIISRATEPDTTPPRQPAAPDAVSTPAAAPTPKPRRTRATPPTPKLQPKPAENREPAAERREPEVPAVNPYAGMRKTQIPVRLFPPLWDRLDELVRDLRAEQLDVDKTALLNAIVHFYGPADIDAARQLVDRWRALLASPPPRGQ